MDMRIAWLAIGTFAISTINFAFAGLLPAIATEMKIGVATAGFVVTAYAVAYAVGAPVMSAIAGGFDARRLLVTAMLTFVIGNGIAVASGSFLLLVAAQVVMGISAGLFASTAQAAAMAMAGPDQRARAISIVFSGTTVAVAFGAPLGSLVAALWGWRGTFLCVALLGLACAAVLWMRLPRGLAGTRLPLGERLAAVNRPGIGSSLLVTLLCLAGGFTIIAYLGPIATLGAGLPELAVPGILLSFGLGAVIGNLGSGYLADRIGATQVIVLSLLASLAVSIAMAIGLKTLPPDVAGPALIAIMLPWGIIGWAFPPAQGSRLVGLAPEAAHLTLSLNVSALFFGIALGTIAGGRMLDLATPSDLPLIAAAFPVAALAVLAWSRRSRATSKKAPAG
jgi:predicted MFS family arabinose efflux permease